MIKSVKNKQLNNKCKENHREVQIALNGKTGLKKQFL